MDGWITERGETYHEWQRRIEMTKEAYLGYQKVDHSNDQKICP